MSSSALNRFPAEIIEPILDDIPRAELPAARLVNKSFAFMAAPRLFRVIPVWISLRSLENITSLSHHPYLHRYVQEIVFSPLRIIDHQDEFKYFSEVKACLEYGSDSMNSAALQLERHVSAYHAYVEAQRYLAKDDLDVKILARALRQFNALQAVNIDQGTRFYEPGTQIGSKELIGAFGSFRANDLLTNDGTHTLCALIRGIAASGIQITRLKIGDWDDISVIKQQCLTQMDFEGSPRGTKGSFPDSLSAKALRDAFLTRQDSHHILTEFEELRVLEIGEIYDDSGHFANLQQMVSWIGDLITHASQLEVVRIDELSNAFSRGKNQQVLIADIFNFQSPLRQIQELELSSMSASLGQLTHLFQASATTLVSVALDMVKCKDKTWAAVLDSLRAFSFPKLKRFQLYNCSVNQEVAYTIEAHEYLLHRTDRNPHSDI